MESLNYKQHKKKLNERKEWLKSLALENNWKEIYCNNIVILFLRREAYIGFNFLKMRAFKGSWYRRMKSEDDVKDVLQKGYL